MWHVKDDVPNPHDGGDLHVSGQVSVDQVVNSILLFYL